jgi:putative transposase
MNRTLREEFPHLRDWCGEHLRASGCFHGSVGQRWEVVEKYIETQDKHPAKSIATGSYIKYGICDC